MVWDVAEDALEATLPTDLPPALLLLLARVLGRLCQWERNQKIHAREYCLVQRVLRKSTEVSVAPVEVVLFFKCLFSIVQSMSINSRSLELGPTLQVLLLFINQI